MYLSTLVSHFQPSICNEILPEYIGKVTAYVFGIVQYNIILKIINMRNVTTAIYCTCTCTWCMRLYMYMYMYFNYPYIYIHTCTILRVCVCMCVCVCVCVCMCVCVCVCVHVDEAHGDRSKDSIRGKCTQYLERADKLKKHISKKGKKVHPSSGGTAHKETKK